MKCMLLVTIAMFLLSATAGCGKSGQAQGPKTSTTAPASTAAHVRVVASSAEVAFDSSWSVLTLDEMRVLPQFRIWCDREVSLCRDLASLEFEYKSYSTTSQVRIELSQVHIQGAVAKYEFEVLCDGEMQFIGPRESGRQPNKVGHIWSRETPEQKGILLAFFVELVP